MVVYDLQCSKKHRFEGWFDDLKDFQSQKRKGLISCPVCGDEQVEKVPSSFGIARKNNQQTADEAAAGKAVAKALVHYIHNNFEDVGPGFAKEALKMHYGASKPRNIRGVSTEQEEKMLADEGVDFFKVAAAAKPETGPEDDED